MSESPRFAVPTSFLTVPLDRHHDRAIFSCSEPSLDRYIQQQARQDIARRLAVTYVFPRTDDPTAIVGYYTLSACAVETDELPPEVTRRLPRYPHLLAIVRAAQGQGYGSALLLDALARIWTQGSAIGCLLAVVDALNERAASFYAGFGFTPFPDHPDRLYLPVATIARLWTTAREQ